LSQDQSTSFPVFVAYEDDTGSDLAVHLKQALENRKIHTFVAKKDIPQTIQYPSDTWRNIINSVIDSCYIFIMILSGLHLTSEMIREVELAFERSKDDPRLHLIICRFEEIPRTSKDIMSATGVDTSHYQQVDFSGKVELARNVNLLIDDRGFAMREYSNLQLAPAYARLSKIVNAAGGVAKAEFREIHTFLDCINSFLDGPFSLVKRRFYPNAWKVGFAYHEYSANSVSYTMYPISFELNDVQIKEVDTSFRDELVALNGMIAYSKENPVKSRSKEHALEIMEKRIEQLTNFRLLDHEGSEFLAREFIIAFVDKFADQIGLHKKDRYTLAEIGNGFYRHLPIWVEETIKLFVRESRNGIKKPADCYYGKTYFEPGILKSQLLPEEVDEVENLVVQRMKTNDAMRVIALGSEEFPFRLFVEFHSFLTTRGVIEVPRLYKPPDYSRVPHGGWIWEPYSSDDVEANLKRLFDALPSVYTAIVEHNLPELKSQLLPFDGATLVVAVFQIKDERPTLALYYLKHEGDHDLRIELLEKSQRKDVVCKLDSRPDKLELNGKTYKLIGAAFMFPRFIYDDLPMLTFVYDELKGALRKYFDKMRGLQ
jgi:hypothetical protein